jgi:hypothetical protein
MNAKDALRSIQKAIDALDSLQVAESDPDRILAIGAEIDALIFQKVAVRWDQKEQRSAGLASAAEALDRVVQWEDQARIGGARTTATRGLSVRLRKAVDADRGARSASRARRRGPRSTTMSGPAVPSRATALDFAGAPPLRILAIHGVGEHPVGGEWEDEWRMAILEPLDAVGRGRRALVDFLHYGDIVERHGVGFFDYAEAIWKLGSSGVVHGIDDLTRGKSRFFGVSRAIRWTAGMVAQWASQEDFRKETRERLVAWLGARSYDLVLAHSLGSLIAYDAFLETPELARGKVFASLGSQIGNPFVRGTFGGRIVPIAGLRWYHLYNESDNAFTHEIRLDASDFVQVETTFDQPWNPLNHSAEFYLSHPNAVGSLWKDVASGNFAAIDAARGLVGRAAGPENRKANAGRDANAAVTGAVRDSRSASARGRARRDRRALLVGINDYPNAEDRLEGCVNDVFLMSQVLQEMDFEPDEIRIVLDDRATAAGIRERLHWLLDGVRDGDQRVFYYSGHGAQIAAYGGNEDVDHVDECLVPWDFDWSLERAITDDDLFELYSQLPYGANFSAVFDCCHSGGVDRAGGRRPKGLTPPDDIRHRAIEWNRERGLWVPRGFKESTFKEFAKAVGRSESGSKQSNKSAARFVGEDGRLHRIGGAAPLRRVPANQELAAAERLPYMPLVLTACSEKEYAYEYRHGVISHGIFTYALVQQLRALERGSAAEKRRGITFRELVARTAHIIKVDLEYEQTPPVPRGPKHIVDSKVPWIPLGGKRASGKRGSGKRARGGRASRGKRRA